MMMTMMRLQMTRQMLPLSVPPWAQYVILMVIDIVTECPLPDATTREDLLKLVGQRIFSEVKGFFPITMSAMTLQWAVYWHNCNTNLGVRDLRAVPRANCVINYNKRDISLAELNGKVACELTHSLYGADQWWVLLKKK